jgi:hypothetical protein
MDSSLIITLEILLVLGVVLGLGGWDLWKLRREQARDRAREALLKSGGAASGKAAGSAPTEH